MDVTAALAQLGIVLLLLAIVGAIAERLEIPAIPLYLLVGLGLGVGGVLPLADVGPFIEVGAELGVIMLLLALGMQFSAAEFIVSLRRHRYSGLVDALLSATPGAVAGVALGLGWQGALALAGVTWVSSSGIIAKLLTDLGRLGNRETPAVLSVLVIEDMAMAVYLPVTAAVLGGRPWWLAVAGATVACVAVTLALLASHRLGSSLANLVGRGGSDQVVIRAIGLTVFVAAIAELVHVSAAVGAFIVGLSLNGAAAARIAELIAPLRDLFAGLFFVGFSIAIDPRTLLPMLPAALWLAAIGIVSKYLVGVFAARTDGVSGRGRSRAGTALIARGEFSIVIAGLAVMSVPGSPIGSLASSYVLILAIVGPVLARYSGEIPGIRNVRDLLRRDRAAA